MTMESVGADWLISSANKCIQGVPGFGFVIARRTALEATGGQARSLSLDLYDQWREMEDRGGKWRYTSPTHIVRAFAQALQELRDEGGVAARHERYTENARRLVAGYERIGFQHAAAGRSCGRRSSRRSCIRATAFSFDAFYAAMKARRLRAVPGQDLAGGHVPGGHDRPRVPGGHRRAGRGDARRRRRNWASASNEASTSLRAHNRR